MNYLKISFWLSVLSTAVLLIVLLLPSNYFVLRWDKSVLNVGNLFPIMIACWLIAILSNTVNFIGIEKALVMDNVMIPQRKKWIPVFITVPSMLSFFWFIFQLVTFH